MADREGTSPPAVVDLGQQSAFLECIILCLNVINVLNSTARNQSSRRDAVISAFIRKFGTKTFWLNLNAPRKRVVIKNRQIVINGLEYCFPFLQIFGGKFSKLVVSSDNRIVNIDRYISQYCNNSLTAITFNYRAEFALDDFSQQFNYVETVRIIECDLGPNLKYFAQWFPNVRRLKIYKGSRDNRLIRVHFPCLQHLYVSFASCISLLRANLHLQSFELNVQSEQRIKFLDIIVYNQTLLKLTVGTSAIIEMSETEIKKLIKEYRLLVELNLQQYQFTADDVIRVICGLNLLKRIRCQLKDHGEYEYLLKILDKEWTCQPIQQNSNVLLIER